MTDGIHDDRLYQIGLTLIPGVGDVLGKKLVHMLGSAEAVFREPARTLRKIPRIGQGLADLAGNRRILGEAEAEIVFLDRYGIDLLFFTDSLYPKRLRNCLDSPVLLYRKGGVDLNSGRAIGIVGTRKATEYGKWVTREIIHDLQAQKVLVVSGLAYGVDSCAHRAALEMGLDTVAVLGHGLDTIYPWGNRPLAGRMLKQGALLTEFRSGTKPDKMNFPRRNRIIAGMCDAILVVEAGSRGGALITADIANSYNRDVFAVPGRISDPASEGTNFLIRTNRAALVRSAEDIEYMMGWKKSAAAPAVQRKIFLEMTPEEERIVALLQERGKTPVDELAAGLEIAMGRLSASLLNLEFEGVVRCLPGKMYEMVG